MMSKGSHLTGGSCAGVHHRPGLEACAPQITLPASNSVLTVDLAKVWKSLRTLGFACPGRGTQRGTDLEAGRAPKVPATAAVRQTPEAGLPGSRDIRTQSPSQLRGVPTHRVAPAPARREHCGSGPCKHRQAPLNAVGLLLLPALEQDQLPWSGVAAAPATVHPGG